MLITNNYDNVGNTNKTIIHIPKHRTNRYSFLFPTRWWGILLIYENLFKQERKTCFGRKKLKCKKFEYSNIKKCETKMLTSEIEKGITPRDL